MTAVDETTRRPSEYMPGELPGPQATALLQRDNDVIAPVGRVYPLVVDHALGCEVWDSDGNRFLDMNAGIAVLSCGHSNPGIVNVVQQQVTKFTHMAGTDFYNEPMIKAAEKLVSFMPQESEWQVFWTNSGTEAIEACMKLARYATGRQNIIGFYSSFHGRSYGALSLTSSKAKQRHGFFPLLPGTTHSYYPNCDHCPINLSYPSCNIACIDMIEKTLFTTTMPPEDVAAIVIEPIQGEGGYVVPPAGALRKLREICDRYGILLIADEVQSGIGRTGKMWAFEHEGIVPDIVASAKGIGGGLPLGAMIARKQYSSKWAPGAHGNTYGGNGLTCAVAYEVLNQVESKWMQNAADVGAYLLERLQPTKQRFPQIGFLRGRGLMIGIEFVKADGSADGALADAIMEEAFRKGVLVLTCGASTIRLCPPLTLTREQADEAVERFELAIEAVVNR